MNEFKPLYVDYHCHLDLYPDHEELLKECERERVATLAVTTTPKAWQRNCDMASSYKHVRVALGLHPQLVKDRANELPLFLELLSDTKFVGEIGLDAGKQFYSSFKQQQFVFESILEACSDKILSIHSAYTSKKVLDSLDGNQVTHNNKVVLHWFSGTQREAERAAEMGCYFSINQSMLQNDKHKKMIASLAVDRVLSETDGPFIVTNNVKIRPKNVTKTVKLYSKLKEVTYEEIQDLFVENLAGIENDK